MTNLELSSLPGPKGLPLVGNLFGLNKKQIHLQLLQWGAKFGPIFKFNIAGQYFVVVSEYETIQKVLRSRPDDFRRMSSIESVFSELAHTGLFSAEGLLIAGEDTTANTLAWMVYFMTNHPDVQERMQREADQILGGVDSLNYDDTLKLSYIEAVAFEAMRLKSVAPFLFLEAKRDVEVHGASIRSGTNVIALSGYEALQDRHFTDAEKFLPQRWLANERPANWNHNPKVALAFGSGPRVCPGRNLSMLETKVVMAMFCRNFTVEKSAESRKVDEQFTFVVEPVNLFVQLRER